MASAAIVDENGFHAPVIGRIFRQTRGPLGAGKLFMEIGECRQLQVHLLFCSVSKRGIRFGYLEADCLRPNQVG